MILGVPTLNRYDLLDKLILSAESGTLKPSEYLIVDNGGRFEAEAPRMASVTAALDRGVQFVVLKPGGNMGVAASWNALLDRAGDKLIAIVNDDVELNVDALERLNAAADNCDFVDAGGGCLFTQTRTCTELVGPYDENFYPAYYEDSDYERRLALAGVTQHRLSGLIAHHEDRATMFADTSGEIGRGMTQNGELFRRKWGDLPGKEVFTEPFNGVEKVDLRLNTRQETWTHYAPQTMRWDVINHIAKVIDAKTYLEVGVSSGESMRQVQIELKIGVDPAPQLEGVTACDVFVPKTSDELFKEYDGSRGIEFDIVFIDGLHHADQAYRDIVNAARTAKIVVVHDSNPSTEEMQRVPAVPGAWTGDVWKAVSRVRVDGAYLVRTIDTDYGVAVVLPNRGERVPELPRETWADLQAHRKELLGLIPVHEWKAWLKGALR